MYKLVIAMMCALVAPLSSSVAAPHVVESFDAGTWAKLQKDLPRPVAVVFTATYCANCPALIHSLSETLSKQGLKDRVVAVVIDEADSQDLLNSKHYVSASRLFAFDGNEATLRYGVDPRWRGVTPYVALLGNEGKPVFAAGTPSDSQIHAWLAGAGE